MAINPYYSPYMPQYYPNQQQYNQQSQSQNANGIIWVQGIEGAKSFYVAPGQTAWLMDSESNCFFIKSVDASGMPMPLRIFDYNERKSNGSNNQQQQNVCQPDIDVSAFVTRKEFEERIAQISDQAKQQAQYQPKQKIAKETKQNAE